jgi:predicted permease
MNLHPALVVPFQLDRAKSFIGNFSYQSFGRLKPGVTLDQASADIVRMLPIVFDKFQPAAGATRKMFESARFGPNLRPLARDVIGDVASVLWVLMGTAGIVLLIACANVANLLLVRAGGRQHELAIRAALGAGTGAIARELLFESVTLGLFGGALGLGIARACIALLVYLEPARLPRLDEITIDLPVLLFAFAVSLASGILFGLVPVFKYAGPRIHDALRAGGRNASHGRERHRTRSALVVVQVALALVLLAGSGLMVRSFQAIRAVQPGFTNPAELLTCRVVLPTALMPDNDQVFRTQHDMLDKVRAIPGVVSAALVNSAPMTGDGSNDPIYPEDRPYLEGTLPPIRRYKFITPGYFQTMGNRIVAGRDFTWTDLVDRRDVVLLSENLAREIWGSAAAAVGKRVRENPTARWREVIGVSGDEYDSGADRKASTIVFWPIYTAELWGRPRQVRRSAVFVVRSHRTGTKAFLDEVRAAIWSVQRDIPIANVRTMREIYDRSMARTSFTLVLLAIAAGIALLLGLIGIYGVISYSVAQRTREIGIRIALGAENSAVRAMFVRHGLRLAAMGVAIGLAAAFALTRLMASLLYGVKPADPLTFGAVAVLLALAVLLASYIPARRATNVDPVEALRAD